ncbi:hypothetical protein OC834_007934 [Tilletia horrida]|nr:hypothetical protein OC834_007934 [Tilletia horrida]
MPKTFKIKPMSKLWSLWNDIPDTAVTSKPALAALLKHARKHCRLRFPTKICAAHMPPWQTIIAALRAHPCDHVDADGDDLKPIDKMLLFDTFGASVSVHHLSCRLDLSHPFVESNYKFVPSYFLHLLAPGMSPLSGIHHIHRVLRGTLLVFDWTFYDRTRNFANPFHWDAADPMRFLSQLDEVKARICNTAHS